MSGFALRVSVRVRVRVKVRVRVRVGVRELHFRLTVETDTLEIRTK